MDGHTSDELTRIWSQMPHAHWSLQGMLSHVHDISLSALAVAIILLGAVILLELRSVVRLRQVTDRSLARVFEQLDLLRFESQQLLEQRQLWEQRQAPVARPQMHAAAPAAPVSTAPPVAPVLAASPMSARAPVSPGVPVSRAVPVSPSIAQTRTLPPGAAIPTVVSPGLSSGEARLLASLAEARARRTAAVEPARA